jgi:hypothetical protein
VATNFKLKEKLIIMTSQKFCARFPLMAITAALALFLPIAGAAQTQVSFTNNSVATPGKSIWKRVKTPNIGGADLLFSLSADSEKDIWSVGDFVSLNFDGQTWTAIPLAVPGGEATMNGITAIAPNNVWAVGSTLMNGNHLISVIQHFDGTRWTIVDSPQFATGSQLQKILAFSANDIFAVGETDSDNQQPQPLVEHFNGRIWSAVSLPALKNGQLATLFGIGGLSHTDFWAVGGSGGSAGIPLVLHFDGKKFKKVPFPSSGVELSAVTAIASNDAWIVGSNGLPLTAHWDGNVWTPVAAPGKGQASGLSAVSAISSTDIWAAGGATVQGSFANLVEHWDGKKWTISPIASPRGGFDELSAVLAFPSGSVFVAGTALNCDGDFCDGFESVVFHTNQGK